MKTKLFLPFLYFAAVTGACGDVTLIFDDHGAGGGSADSGVYAPGDTITFDIFIRFTGPPPADLASITIYFQSLQNGVLTGNRFFVTGLDRTGTHFPNGTAYPYPQPMNSGAEGADNPHDLGAARPSGSDLLGPGDYFLGRISFQLSPSAPPAVYTLRNVYAPVGTPNGAHGTVAFDHTGFDSVDVRSVNYTVTVPEPGAVALAAFGVFILGGVLCKRRAQFVR